MSRAAQGFFIGTYGNKSLMINVLHPANDSQTDGNPMGGIYAFDSGSWESEFTCQLTLGQLVGLHDYLAKIDAIKARPTNLIKDNSATNHDELLELLSQANPAEAVLAIRALVQNNLSRDDINTILGRKDSLSTFEKRMATPELYDERSWQSFFKENDWIFGYGLRYRYLSILQQECHVSSVNLAGGDSVIADFLTSDNRFTKLVELKRPDTRLFKNHRNRSDSWCLSAELTDAVSQILAQKVNWEIKSQTPQFSDSGKRILESTYDPDCILIIGMTREFNDTDISSTIKKKTIELYRRNLRNIEIIFYDELLERAQFIVNGTSEALSP